MSHVPFPSPSPPLPPQATSDAPPTFNELHALHALRSTAQRGGPRLHSREREARGAYRGAGVMDMVISGPPLGVDVPPLPPSLASPLPCLSLATMRREASQTLASPSPPV